MKSLFLIGALVALSVGLHGQTAPSFVSQPSNVTATDGGSFTINVTVNTSLTSVRTDFGSGFVIDVPTPADVSWRVNLRDRSLAPSGVASASVNTRVTASISFGPIAAADAGVFQIVATNVFGSTLSEVRTLTVTPAGPSIVTQPVNQIVGIGGNATLSVTAGGTAPLSFQWRKDGAIISGATGATLTLQNIQTTATGSYTVTITNSVGSITSNAALVSLTTPPAISSHPLSQPVPVGTSASLTVTASGSGPLSYQWVKDGVAISGATGATLDLQNVQANAAGNYSVNVTNIAGTVTSNAAVVSVTFSNVGRLINLSILTTLSEPGASFTLGFVVGGGGTHGTKPLVIRAVGPSLGALGVPATIADPVMELFVGARSTGSNDNWGGAAAVSAAMAAVGAFPFIGPTSRDSAMLAEITTRDNSVKVSGVGDATGAVIAEIYDATPSDRFTSTTPRLVNVSVLKDIGSGLTAGFVVAGNASVRVLIRGVGPSLATLFGVGGAVSDPTLVLFGANSAVVATNDNWNAGDAGVFATVGAFQLGTGSRDAALAVTLQPGNYTVQVNGVADATGVALVEIYEVPQN